MCDTAVVVREGSVLFAKNSDRDPNEAQYLDWQPARDHEAGSALKCSYLEIPQVAHTHAILLSRPYWIWGGEMGANEHGVTIGNEGVFTRQPYARTGLTGMDLLRLALERAATAEEAVAVIQGLLAEHGQGGGCGHEDRSFSYHNSYLIADPTGAFVLETADKLSAVEKVSGARSISNGLTIPDFAREQSDSLKTYFSRCRQRQPQTQRLAGKASDLAGMMRLLRDHGPDRSEPVYGWATGTLDVPCMHGGGLLAASQTTASWVAELRPGSIQHWVTATSSPCTSLFKPVSVETPLDLGPTPNEKNDPESLWWRHERFQRRVMRDPARLRPLFVNERDEVEAGWLANPPSPEKAFTEGDALLAKWTEAVEAAPGTDTRPWLVRRYWAKRNGWAGLAIDP